MYVALSTRGMVIDGLYLQVIFVVGGIGKSVDVVLWLPLLTLSAQTLYYGY